MRISRALGAAIVALLVGAMGAGAQSPPTNGTPLGVEDAVKLALERNLELKIESLTPLIAKAQERGARGAFDPILDAGVTYAHTERFLNTVLEGAARSGIVVENIFTADYPSFTGRLPTGTQYGLTLTTPITNSNSPIRLYDESYQSSLTLGITQPLLRDFGLEINMVRVNQAKISTAQAERSVEAKMLDVIRQTETRYWQLFYAERHVGVAQTALALAEDLVAQLKRLKEAGLAREIELTQARSTVDQRRAALVKARADLASARGLLRLVIDPRSDGVADYSAAQMPPDLGPPSDLPDKRARALASRPEIKLQELLLSNLALDERVAVNLKQWRFDLTAGAGYGSLAGSGVNPAFTGTLPSKLRGRDSYSDVFDDYFTADGNTNYWIGARLRIPLGNNEAQAKLAEVRLRRRQEELRLAMLKVQIATDVEGAFEATGANAERLAAARKDTGVAQEQLAIRQRELQAGLATSRQVLEAQDAVARALDEEHQAWTTYATSLSRLEAGYGETFSTYRLVIQK